MSNHKIEVGDMVIYYSPVFPQSHKPVAAIVSEVTGVKLSLHCFFPDRSAPQMRLAVSHRAHKATDNEGYWDFKSNQSAKHPVSDGKKNGVSKGPGRG